VHQKLFNFPGSTNISKKNRIYGAASLTPKFRAHLALFFAVFGFKQRVSHRQSKQMYKLVIHDVPPVIYTLFDTSVNLMFFLIIFVVQ
jgi:hypothetical protein